MISRLFDTAIGRCRIDWTCSGISGVWLPGSAVDDAAGGREPPEFVRDAIDGIVGLLSGSRDNLRWVELDWAGVPTFAREVYEAARAVPPGQTVSYGELAARVNAPGSAQAVGRAMGANPFPIVVPCHRVLAADGTLHGFSAPGGLETKRRMLAIEGALAPTLFD